MTLILGTNSIKGAGSFQVDNSVRMNRGDNSSFTRSVGSNGDFNNATLSMWVKKCSNGIDTNRLWLEYETGSNYEEVRFRDDDTLRIYSESGGGTYFEIITNRKFLDVSAWYHICVLYDYTQATASNRIKLYVNGVQETSFSTYSVPAQNGNSSINKSGNTIYVGAYPSGSNYFDGYLAEVLWLDGTTASITDLGEFDEDSPQIWKPIDVSDLTAGTNGWYMDFKSSGSLGNDVFGSNNLTANNLASTDQSIDTCTNNFATLNPLAWTTGSGLAFSDGNLKLVNSDNGWRPAISNIAVTKGKWVAEVKVVAVGSASKYGIIDVLQYNDESNLFYNLATGTRAWTYRAFQGKVYNNTSDAGGSSYGNSFTTNDIIGIYLDCDNNKIYWSKNGVVQNSGTGISITDGYDYAFALNLYNSTAEINFGSPSYSITSGNTDGEFGNFEYSKTITGDGASKVFKALCTKNLAEYGG